MEGDREPRECRLKRCYQCNRVEEQLWSMAYEQLWPLLRRRLIRQEGKDVPSVVEQAQPLSKGA